jgi:hypothetical protein
VAQLCSLISAFFAETVSGLPDIISTPPSAALGAFLTRRFGVPGVVQRQLAGMLKAAKRHQVAVPSAFALLALLHSDLDVGWLPTLSRLEAGARNLVGMRGNPPVPCATPRRIARRVVAQLYPSRDDPDRISAAARVDELYKRHDTVDGSQVVDVVLRLQLDKHVAWLAPIAETFHAFALEEEREGLLSTSSAFAATTNAVSTHLSRSAQPSATGFHPGCLPRDSLSATTFIRLLDQQAKAPNMGYLAAPANQRVALTKADPIGSGVVTFSGCVAVLQDTCGRRPNSSPVASTAPTGQPTAIPKRPLELQAHIDVSELLNVVG